MEYDGERNTFLSLPAFSRPVRSPMSKERRDISTRKVETLFSFHSLAVVGDVLVR